MPSNENTALNTQPVLTPSQAEANALLRLTTSEEEGQRLFTSLAEDGQRLSLRFWDDVRRLVLKNDNQRESELNQRTIAPSSDQAAFFEQVNKLKKQLENNDNKTKELYENLVKSLRESLNPQIPLASGAYKPNLNVNITPTSTKQNLSTTSPHHNGHKTTHVAHGELHDITHEGVHHGIHVSHHLMHCIHALHKITMMGVELTKVAPVLGAIAIFIINVYKIHQEYELLEQAKTKLEKFCTFNANQQDAIYEYVIAKTVLLLKNEFYRNTDFELWHAIIFTISIISLTAISTKFESLQKFGDDWSNNMMNQFKFYGVSMPNIASYPDLAKDLQALITHYAANSTTRKKFTGFLTDLTCLDGKTKMCQKVETFFVKYSNKKLALDQKSAYYTDLNKKLNAGELPALCTVKLLNSDMKNDEEEKKYNEMESTELAIPFKKGADFIKKKLDELETQLVTINKETAAKIKLETSKAPTKGAAPWSDQKRQTLEDTLKDLAKEVTIACKFTDFLSQVAERLLELNKQIDEKLDYSFNEILNNALKNYTYVNKNPEMLAYWSLTIRAMLMLGASPVSWINEQVIPHRGTDIDIAPSVLQASLLVAHLSRITMAHLQAHSTHYGEALSHLNTSLDNFIEATNDFAVALYNTCESPEWRVWFFERLYLRNISGEARNIRLQLFWSTIQLCHFMLNNIGTPYATNFDSIRLAMSDFEAFENKYREAVTYSYWRSSTGYSEFQKLLTSFGTVIKNVKVLEELRAAESKIETSQQATQQNEVAEVNLGAAQGSIAATNQEIQIERAKNNKLLRKLLQKELIAVLKSLSNEPSNNEILSRINELTNDFASSNELSGSEVELLLNDVVAANTELGWLRPFISPPVTLSSSQSSFFSQTANAIPTNPADTVHPAEGPAI